METRLSHEDLDVYQAALSFLNVCAGILARFPRGYSDLSDQLRRASSSISLNIAEGAGKTSRADAARFYAIARGSAYECGAVLDNCRIFGLASDSEIANGKVLLIKIARMLTRLARSSPLRLRAP